MMTDALADAIVEYLSSQYGGMFSGNVQAYVTSVAATQEAGGLATLDITAKLVDRGGAKPKKPKSPWVAVKSRLPDVDEPVLVCFGDAVAIGACDDDEMFVRTDSLAVFWPQPTHWQPLPAGVA